MATREPPLTIGIEEEYLLVDRETRAVASEPPAQLFADLHERTGGRAFPEFLRSQVEVATPVCRSVGEARVELGRLRRAVIEESARHGLAPIAASSHPFSLSAKQKRTEKERGGWLGPIAAAALGMLSGLLRGIFDTHNLFTVLDLGLMGALFAVAVRQKYRTPLYRLLHQPLVGALSIVAVHVIVFVFTAFFAVSSSASVTERLDYAFSNVGITTLAFGGEMLIAGIAAQVMAVAFPAQWGGLGSLQPSPAEKSIETRFVSGTGTIISILLVTLLVGDWIVGWRESESSSRI